MGDRELAADDSDAQPAADLPLRFIAPPAFYQSNYVPQRCVMTGEQRDLVLHNFRVKAEKPDQEIVIGRKATVQLSITRQAAFRILYAKTLCWLFGALGVLALGAGIDSLRHDPLLVLPFPFNWMSILVAIVFVALAVWAVVGLPLVVFQGTDIALFIPRRAAETHAAFEQALADWAADTQEVGNS